MKELVNNKKAQIIILLVCLVAFSFFVTVNISPDKFFIPPDDPEGGIRMIRDDFELRVFYQRGSWLPQDLTPYNREIFQEYPQLGLSYLTLPYLFTNDYQNYKTIIILFNFFCFLGLIYVTYKIFRKLNKSVLYLLLFLLPSVAYFVFSRFDIVVVLLMQISFYLLLSRKYRASIIFLALAFLTKWYPLLFLPLYFYYLRGKMPVPEFKKIGKEMILIFFAIIFVVMVFSYAIDGIYSLVPYFFHSARPAAVGSLYHLIFQSSFLKFGLDDLNYIGISLFFLLQFSIPLIFIFQPKNLQSYLTDKRQLIMWMSMAILIFLLFSRFYSPQWILWFLPLLVLVINSKLEIILLIVYDIINYLAFPVIWQSWGFDSILFTIASSVLVVIIIVLIIILLRRIKSSHLINENVYDH